MSKSIDARMQRSRQALRDALLALLEDRPFDEITVRAITGHARVGYATFFRHFSGKDALLNDVAGEQIAALCEMTTPLLLAADSRATCRAICATVDARRALWSAMLTGSAAGTVREQFVRNGRLLGQLSGSGPDWLPTDLSIVWTTSGCVDVLHWWLTEGTRYSVEQMAEIMDRLVIGPSVSGRIVPGELCPT